MRGWLHRKAYHRGLHGRKHVGRQRQTALLMIGSGLFRVGVWTVLLVLYLVHAAFARSLFASVAFVAVLSVLALMLTDWGQVAASFAQLAAADSHADAEHNRRTLDIDFAALERDVAALAALEPGPDADRLAADIRARFA